MSATRGDLRVITDGLRATTGRVVAVVRGRQRPVPLEFEYRETPLHETIDELVKAGRAPIYLVNVTQRGAADQAQNLMSVKGVRSFPSPRESPHARHPFRCSPPPLFPHLAVAERGAP